MVSDFEQKIKNPKSPVAVDLSHNNSSLLIAFGGIAGALGVPPFEFFNLSKDLNINKIYMRDHQQSWYHRGLPNLAEDIDGIANFLEQNIQQAKPKNLVLVGNSMGAYAAILFGTLINADVVHAFSPQTFIDKENRKKYRDKRWGRQIKKTHKILDEKYFDLNSLLSKKKSNCDINIYYSIKDKLDKLHAEHLIPLPNIKLHAFQQGDHSIVKNLRDSGELKTIVNNSILTTAD